MHDLVIRDAKIVDGSGAPSFCGDVAVDGEVIVEVGTVGAKGKREISADGRLATPGWVDLHTHYDGQVTWDPMLSPSSEHGCTTLVMGNCGVGFAPVRPDHHEKLIILMEGVEDIPGVTLAEGLKWNWQSFPEYLNALEAMPRAVDVGVQIAHAPVRVFVMGERGARNEPSTAEDIDQMREVVREAMEVGALGFSTSRFLGHRGSDGTPLPGTFANTDEIRGIVTSTLAGSHPGFFQFACHVNDHDFYDTAFDLSINQKIPMGMSLQQVDWEPDMYRDWLQRLAEVHQRGGEAYAMVHGRTTGVLMCFDSTVNPFSGRRAYQEIANLPLAQRIVRLRDPAVRQAILAEPWRTENEYQKTLQDALPKAYEFGDPPEYEPDPETCLAKIAAQKGCTVEELAYDIMLRNDGNGIVYFPTMNYSYGNLDATLEMMEHPCSRLSLGDGGAHCGFISDYSLPTFMLSHWTRDRTRGRKLSIEQAVHMQTGATAKTFRLLDRGILARGYKADINLIDYDNLRLSAPEMVHDLPAGGRRFMQKAFGYDATIVSGVPIFEGGEATGALPGRLIRGRRPQPSVA